MAGLVLRGVIGVGSRALPAAGRGLGQAFGAASRGIGGLWGRNLTVGGTVTAHAATTVATRGAVYGISQYEEHSGGQLTDESINLGVSTVKGLTGIVEGMSREELAERLNDSQAILGALHAGGENTSELVRTVRAIQTTADHDDPEAMVEAGKNAAILHNIRNLDNYALAMAVRGQIYREADLNMGNEERNGLVVEGLLNDMVTNSNCDALAEDGIVLEKEDIGQYLAEHPDQMSLIPPDLREGFYINFPELRPTSPEATSEISLTERARAAASGTAQTAAGAARGAAADVSAAASEQFNLMSIITAPFRAIGDAFNAVSEWAGNLFQQLQMSLVAMMAATAMASAAQSAELQGQFEGARGETLTSTAEARPGTASAHFGSANERPTNGQPIDPDTLAFLGTTPSGNAPRPVVPEPHAEVT